MYVLIYLTTQTPATKHARRAHRLDIQPLSNLVAGDTSRSLSDKPYPNASHYHHYHSPISQGEDVPCTLLSLVSITSWYPHMPSHVSAIL